MKLTMEHLNVGATYIFERNGEEIYAREAGQTNRVLIGYQYEGKTDPRTDDGRPLHEHMQEEQLWNKIRRTARTNPVLQSELERVIMLYNLINSEK